MTERGILFSAPMVRALLDGTKTQTRSVLKSNCQEIGERDDGTPWPWSENPETGADHWHACPYGEPGDRLWVRETFFAYGRWETRYNEKKQPDEWHFVDMTAECGHAYGYAAANDLYIEPTKGRGATPGWYTRPAIFMPRAASRILLEIVAVRVERLQDISESDAAAEGWSRRPEVSDDPQVHVDAARDWYMDLWEQINGAGSWAVNPWVWVVEFRRIEG